MSADKLPVLPECIFQTIFESSPGSLLVKADIPCFTILAASDTYLEITSSTRELVLGRSFFEVFPDDKDFEDETNARKVFTRVVKTGHKIDVPTYRFDVFNRATQKYEVRYWSCCNTPIFDADHKVAYVLNTVVDITGEVQAKQAAIESEKRLRLATEAAALATWDLNLKDQQFIYSPRLAEIFGHAPETKMDLAQIRCQVNTDDMRDIVLKAFKEALTTGNYLYEVRIYWADGSIHWIKTQGIVLHNDRHEPVRMIGTILDITESKRDAIRKNDFIAMASHELKTPLTSIKAYLQLLAKKLLPTDDSFVANALSKAGNQVNKMTELVHGFLDLSKLESGKLNLRIKAFDINKLIDDAIAEINMISTSHIIAFNSTGVIIINADKEKILQVIGNFLSNAIKYADKGTRITIKSEVINGDVKVSVTDEGIGISIKDQANLFQRFYRVESDKMKNISGFGIGLYLASEIIQCHKGQIGVESEEDKGATFYFSLPLADQVTL
ncbi:ATP-binding protein [Mucilaginibacter sp.]|uniref:ATP-binding protein n=1 Tax=Mucilaginibacter sp. TaxID=1882438 RepID=UPI003D0AA812